MSKSKRRPDKPIELLPHQTTIRIVANNVRYHRVKQGLSQPELAEKSNRSVDVISDIENMKHDLKARTLDDISKGLGMTTLELLSDPCDKKRVDEK